MPQKLDFSDKWLRQARETRPNLVKLFPQVLHQPSSVKSILRQIIGGFFSSFFAQALQNDKELAIKVFCIENEDNEKYSDKFKDREVKKDKEELGVKVLQRASPPPAGRRDL